MGTVPIAGLTYNGKQCSYDDGQATTTPPEGGGSTGSGKTPPVAGSGPNSYLYSKVKTGTPDNFWLGKKLYDYRQDLADDVLRVAQESGRRDEKAHRHADQRCQLQRPELRHGELHRPADPDLRATGG